MMLAQEAAQGSGAMAVSQAFMGPGGALRLMGNNNYGNSILFASQNNESPTPTTYGSMDLDYFIHMNFVATKVRIVGLASYAAGKTFWNAAYGVRHLFTGKEPGWWETPFTGDPGEGVAAKAYLNGAKLKDLFGNGLLEQLCPEGR